MEGHQATYVCVGRARTTTAPRRVPVPPRALHAQELSRSLRNAPTPPATRFRCRSRQAGLTFAMLVTLIVAVVRLHNVRRPFPSLLQAVLTSGSRQLAGRPPSSVQMYGGSVPSAFLAVQNW